MTVSKQREAAPLSIIYNAAEKQIAPCRETLVHIYEEHILFEMRQLHHVLWKQFVMFLKFCCHE